jgi:large subunit ribosomal protein L21
MYAVIRTGGKQYRVAEGDRIQIEKLEASVGDTVNFEEVLLVDDGSATQVGTPLLNGATVSGEVVSQGKGEKIIVFKYKPRKGYRRRTGHRQQLTDVNITGISVKGSKKASKPKASAAPTPEPAPEAAPEVEAGGDE